MKLTEKLKPPADSRRFIPILPRSGLYMPRISDPHGYLGVSESGYQGFAKQFKETFHRLPRSARLKLVAFWQDLDAGRCAPSPEIYLTRAIGEYGGRNFAGVQAGIRLKFHPIVVRMPDAVLQDLIGHELAHVFQWATGELTSDMDGYDEGACEEDADWRMERWGFDPDSIDDWAEQDGLPEFAGLSSSGHDRYAPRFVPMHGHAD